MTVRVFLLSSGVCFLALTSVSWQNFKMFYSSQYEQKQAQMISEVNTIAINVDNILKRYRNLVEKSAMDSEGFKSFVEHWHKYNGELLYGVYVIDLKTQQLVRKFWQMPNDNNMLLGKSPEIAELAAERQAKSFINMKVKEGTYFFDDAQESMELPLVTLVYTTSKESKNPKRVVALAWKSQLFGPLLSTENKQFLLASPNDSLVGLGGKSPVKKSSLDRNYFKKIFEQKRPIMFFERIDEGLRSSVKPWTTAFRKLSAQDNIFIVNRESYNDAFLGIKTVIGATLLWACLFGLLMYAGCYFTIFNYSKGLRRSINALRRLSKGDLSPVQFENHGFEINGLNYAINRLSENFSRALRQQKSQAQQTKTIEMSEAIKQGIMPLHKPNHPHLGVTTFSRQTSDFNGNWFGVTNLGPGINCVFMGENSGRGAGTAIMAASLCAACESLVKASARTRNGVPDIEEVMSDLNNYMVDAGGGNNVARLFLAITNFQKGTIDYVNAGMQKPFIIQRQKPEDKAKKSIKAAEINQDAHPIVFASSSMPLGIKQDYMYRRTNVAMKPGDKFFIFSTGLVKCRSILGRPWGRKSLIENALTLAKSTADATREELIERVAHHSRGADIVNDIGLLILEVSKEWQVGMVIEEEAAAS